ncbi:MAG: hypothetical protein U0840_31295 [Gemmataceae bacterium]
MNDPGPYLRAHLPATRLGLTDPSLRVEHWLHAYRDLAGTAHLTPDEAYTLIATQGRLLRCRPELLAQVDAAGCWNEQAAWTHRWPELLTLAGTLPEPASWLQEAGKLAEACDQGGDEEQLAAWAERLLSDLDDADLVAWSTRQHGSQQLVLEHGLTQCLTWVVYHSDRFFPATVFIQEMGQTIRPDLAGLSLELASTVEKFVVLLDALELMQEQLGPLRPPLKLVQESWAGFPEPAPAVAAATPGDAGLFRRCWLSPDRRTEAELVVGPAPPGVEVVRVLFLRESQVDPSLGGKPVWLAGCPGVIGPAGQVDFSQNELRAAREAGEPLTLLVGDERQAWRSA